MSGFSETIGVEGGLVKFQSILVTDPDYNRQKNGDFVFFGHENEEDDTYRAGTEYVMTRKDYEELGAPTQITITIEPGDTLNDQIDEQ